MVNSLKQFILKLTFVAYFIYCVSFQLLSQHLPFNINTYTNKQYGRQYESAIWSVTQDSTGMLYAGTANGILSYDASNWDFIPVAKGKWVTSMATSKSNTIFIGSQSEFGKLRSTKNGRKYYQSLSNSVEVPFSIVWKVHSPDWGIVFQAEEAVFIYTHDSLYTVLPETSFHLSFLIENTVYIRHRNHGLMSLKIVNGKLSYTKISSQPQFQNKGVFYIHKNNKILNCFTQNSEDFSFDLQKQHINKSTYPAPPDFLVSCGYSLPGGNLVLGSLNNGMSFFDPWQKHIMHLNTKNGLADPKIRQIIYSRNGQLFGATNNGICQIDYTSPFRFIDEKNGLEGAIITIAILSDILFVGTSNGLYKQKKSSNMAQAIAFEPVKEINTTVFAIKRVNNNLLVGTKEGIFKISGNGIQKITSWSTNIIYYNNESDIILAGGPNGVLYIPTDFNKSKSFNISDINADINAIAKDRKNNACWLGTNYQGAIKLTFKDKLNNAPAISQYSAFDGLNEDWVIPFEQGDSVCFGTSTGLLRFVHEDEVKKSLPDSLKNNPEFYRGYFEPVNYLNKTQDKPIYIYYQFKNEEWLSIDNQIVFNNKNNDELVQQAFLGLDPGKINSFFSQNDTLTWIAANEALIAYNKHMEMPDIKFNALIQSIKVSNDSILCQHISPGVPEAELLYKYNSLQFECAAPFFKKPEKTLYSFLLSGYNKTWSNWGFENKTSYTNLSPGKYIFQVKAKNILGIESQPTAYTFHILPPWYLTPAGYAFFLFIFICIIFIAIRIGNYSLRKKNEHLENIIQKRTAEIRAQNEMLGKQKQVIEQKNRDIVDSIQYASRIQRALLPTDNQLQNHLGEYFVYYRPRDIVSGDFFWLSSKEGKIITIAADCTGHGVPGAFVSMLGIAFLNEIVNKLDSSISASEIINELRKYVIKSLKQNDSGSRDGMDMAICIIDKKNAEIQYAGAHNSLLIIRDNELIELKADKMPVGMYINADRPFNNKIMELKQNDCLYMYSDGYVDQFGGPKGKKFMSKRFKQLLLKIASEPMQKQEQILDETITDWKKGKEQIDDILVFGIRIG